jgi:hypothetical protein
MANGSFRATETERVRKRRMPIDLFFRSLADGYGRDSLAIILSGACSDSTLGLKRTKECGGVVFAQEPEDAEYENIPRSAIRTKLVDIVLPAVEIPTIIILEREWSATRTYLISSMRRRGSACELISASRRSSDAPAFSAKNRSGVDIPAHFDELQT